MKTLLLGIDIGTSGLKIGAFSPEEGCVAAVAESYTVQYPHAGWAEQDPDMWWEALCRGLTRLWKMGKLQPEDIRGIAVDGQSWSCIPLDAEGHVLHPTPIWMDARTEDICRRVKETVGEERIFRTAGNPFQPGYTTPKLIWFKEQRPEVYRKTQVFLQSNSFIVYRLTGVVSQDLSMSYGLHVVDQKTGRYDEELADLLGVDLEKLPADNFSCDAVVGEVTRMAAKKTGLKEGTPVVCGGLDAACGTLGAGVILPGQTQEQGGTAGGMSICMDRAEGDPRLILGHHVVPGRWLLQGGTVGGGASLDWIVKEIGEKEIREAKEQGTSRFVPVSTLADSVAPGSDGLIFLPYLSGERSPIWNAKAKGMFFGLSFDKTRAHMYRAVMEGVAFSLRHNLETAEAAGAQADALYSIGGGATSEVWTQLKADITGKVIHVPRADSATTLGASILAGIGTGVYKSYEEAVRQNVQITKTYHPDEERHARYEGNYRVYRALYEQTKNLL